MEYDELELDTLGDKKTALFIITSDTDSTFDFLSSMVVMQMFNTLCTKADDVYGGRLPIHVRCLLDEFANIKIPDMQRLISVIRSREISACFEQRVCTIFEYHVGMVSARCKSQGESQSQGKGHEWKTLNL